MSIGMPFFVIMWHNASVYKDRAMYLPEYIHLFLKMINPYSQM